MATWLGTAILTVAATATASLALAQARPDYKDDKAVRRWMGDNAILGTVPGGDRDWIQMGVAPEGVYFARRQLEGTLQRGVTTVVSRLELFEPVVQGGRAIQSITADYEVDCRRKTSRRVLFTTYPRHNLSGEPVVSRLDEAFLPTAGDKILMSIASDACFAADQAVPGYSRGALAGTRGGIVLPHGR